MSKRKAAKALTQWNEEARQWATAAGRQLALDLYYGRKTASRPYGVGVVLDAGEVVWGEAPVRFSLASALPPNAGDDVQGAPRTWLVTSSRVVARLADDRLYGYRWDKAVGARVELSPGREYVSIDMEGEASLIWSGPGVGPMAVAAVFRLYGPLAMIEHPGLAILRDSADANGDTHTPRQQEHLQHYQSGPSH
jgi:hypothetical protein